MQHSSRIGFVARLAQDLSVNNHSRIGAKHQPRFQTLGHSLSFRSREPLHVRPRILLRQYRFVNSGNHDLVRPTGAIEYFGASRTPGREYQFLPKIIHSFCASLWLNLMTQEFACFNRQAQEHMNQLIESLPEVLKAARNSPEVAEAAALTAWKHAVGDGLRDRTVPLRLEDRKLIVAVADAIWQKQMHSMRGQLLFRIDTILGQPIVGEIEYVIDPKLAVAVEAQKAEEPLDNEVPLELWSAANAIHDKELRRSFLKAALHALKRRT
jgi:hypothetical protein